MTYGSEHMPDFIRSCVLLPEMFPLGSTGQNPRNLLHLRFGTIRIFILIFHLTECSHSHSWKQMSEKCHRKIRTLSEHIAAVFRDKKHTTQQLTNYVCSRLCQNFSKYCQLWVCGFGALCLLQIQDFSFFEDCQEANEF